MAPSDLIPLAGGESRQLVAECPLGVECARLLETHDLYAEAQSFGAAIDIRDSDGEYLATVSASICGFDLAALLRFGNKRFNEGEARGEREARQRMRAALGIAEAA